MIASSITYVYCFIFSDLKTSKDLNPLILWVLARKKIHHDIQGKSSMPGRSTKSQPGTSSNSVEPKPSTSSGKRKVRSSKKGDTSKDSRSSTSLAASVASRKQVKLDKKLFGMCVDYETDMVISNVIKEDVRDVVNEVIKECQESDDKMINEVCNSLKDKIPMGTVINVLNDERKEILHYKDFIYNFSKEILDESMLEVEMEKIVQHELQEQQDQQEGFKLISQKITKTINKTKGKVGDQRY